MENSTKIKIPQKYQKMIKQIYKDDDGYWVQTEKGYYAQGTDPWPGCHTIHEDMVQDILKQIRQIKPCDCNYCKN